MGKTVKKVKAKQVRKRAISSNNKATNRSNLSQLRNILSRARQSYAVIPPEFHYTLIIIVLITLFGVVIYELNHPKNRPLQQDIGQVVALKKFEMPMTFAQYKSPRGISFAYPKSWGTVKEAQSDVPEFSFSSIKKTMRMRLVSRGYTPLAGIDGDCSKSLEFTRFSELETTAWDTSKQSGDDFDYIVHNILTTHTVHIGETFEHYSIFPVPGSCPGLRFNAYVALKNNPAYQGVAVMWYEYCPAIKSCGVETTEEYTNYKKDPTTALSLGDRNTLMLFFKSISE